MSSFVIKHFAGWTQEQFFYESSFYVSKRHSFFNSLQSAFLVAAFILPPAPYIGFGVILAGHCYFGCGSSSASVRADVFQFGFC